MLCFDCGKAELVSERKRHRYLESGLENVVLDGVMVSTCPVCASESVSIPRITQLHRSIAKFLISKSEALGPAEIQFLRKSLGWSSIDFSQCLHVDNATIKRWENRSKPQAMGAQAELLLRLAVSQNMKLKDYSLHRFQTFSFPRIGKREPIFLKQDDNNWTLDVAV